MVCAEGGAPRPCRGAVAWAWTEIGGRIVTLLQVRVTDDFPRALAPAEAAVRRDGIAVVRAGEGAVELHAGRCDEDETPLAPGDLANLVASARRA